MAYQPPAEILEKYAKVLVNYALWSGEGVRKGDVVYLQGQTSSLPFYNAIEKQLLLSGAHIIGRLSDDENGMARFVYQNASDEQLTFFPKRYYKAIADLIDHRIAILSDHDPHELDGVDPKKIMLRQKSAKPLIQWLDRKEDRGKHTWTLASYGTEATAKEAGLTIEEYWDQIIKACFLDLKDPIAKWRQVSKEIHRIAERLTKMKIEWIHLEGVDADLHVKIGTNRNWMGGSGRNIPSFEIFTSPDWRGTEGWVSFNQPVTKYSLRIDGIQLKFKKGVVTEAIATKNQKFLHELLATDKGASRLGEFSLTDSRMSRITKPMHDDLYDENMGGKYGNTHMAVGRSYFDTYLGDVAKVGPQALRKLGFNESVVHTDMISTTDRTVTATLENGKKLVIYKKGQFTV